MTHRQNLSRFLRLLILGACLLLPMPARGTPAPPNAVDPAPEPSAVVLELFDVPVAAIYTEQRDHSTVAAAQATASAQLQLAAIVAAQEAVLSQVAALGVPVLYRTQRVYNGIAVLADTAQIERLRSVPGVKDIRPIRAKEPDNSTSVPFLGAPQLWRGGELPGVRGEGMRIAIVDTGVDYLHTDFAGPGTSESYDSNDRTVIGDLPGFPGTRVVGGYDFAGDTYNADPKAFNYQPIPKPDPDPMDCYSHGTHVAGTAAGSGVKADGTTFEGPYDDTVAFGNLRVGPGVAPLATIYALKVFGCTGSSDITDLAIEWAVDPNGDGDFTDHMDVINLSLGSPYGAADDLTVTAADNAAAVGVIVVASAGNSRDSYMVVGSPSTGDRVISVAATQHNTAGSKAAQTGTDVVPGFTSRGPRRMDAALKPDLAAPGTSIVSASYNSGNQGRMLSGTSMAAPHVAGAMALLRQLHPTWSVEELKALAMNTAFPLVRTADALTAPLYSPPRTGAGRLNLPATVLADTVALVADPPGQVSISFGSPEIASSSSASKDIRIANKGIFTRTYALSYFSTTDMPGVDFLLPHEAVTVAPGDIASFAVTMQVDTTKMQRTRDNTVSNTQSGPRQWLSEESGHILLWPTGPNLQSNLTSSLIAPSAATAATGSAQLTYDPVSRTLQYTLAVEGLALADITGVDLSLGRPGETGSTLYSLYRSGNALDTGKVFSGTFALTPSHELWLASNSTYVNVTTVAHPDGEIRGQVIAVLPVLHLPIYAAPRVTSAMRASSPVLDYDTDATRSQTISLTGQGLSGTIYPTEVLSLASVIELQLSSPNTRPKHLGEDEQDRYDHADLKYVGVTSDYRAGVPPSVEGSTLYFGLAMHGPWSTPNEVELNIYMDTNRDGTFDYRVMNGDMEGYDSDVMFGDAFVSILENLRTGQKTIQLPLNGVAADRYDSGLFFTNAVVIAVPAAALGLSEGKTAFNYYVNTYSEDLGYADTDLVDATPVLQYDLANGALDFTGGRNGVPLYDDLPGTTLAVGLNLSGYAALRPQGILLLHHHNSVVAKAEVIAVHYTWPYQRYLPVIGR